MTSNKIIYQDQLSCTHKETIIHGLNNNAYQKKAIGRDNASFSFVIENEDEIVLNEDRSSALFRVFQETLTNIFRHSQATKILVSLKRNSDKLHLKIKDNGIGITPEQTNSPTSFGLIGIRERIHFLNGTTEIKGQPNKGTSINVVIPLA